MYGKLKNRRNLEQKKTDGSNRKMRRTDLIDKCSRCKQRGHNKTTCKMTPTTHPTQKSQATQPTQPSEATQQAQSTQASHQTQSTPQVNCLKHHKLINNG